MINNKLKDFFIGIFILIFILFHPLIIKAQEIPEISDEIREMVSEKDLLEIFCLMTKWKSGEFFASLDALEEVLTTSLQELNKVGMDAEMPNFNFYKSQGQKKMNIICQATSWKEAQGKTRDFISFGESVRNDLNNINGNWGQNLKMKGEELRLKILEQVDILEKQEKARIEEEIENEINHLANQLRSQLEQQAQNMNFTSEEQAQAFGESGARRIKATIEAKANEMVDQKKMEIDRRINDKVSEIVGWPIEQFKAIGDKMANIEETIKKTANDKLKQYEQYKIQAMTKRKNLIMAVLDKKIEEAIILIKEKSFFLGQARKNDPSVKTSDEYIAELQADKEILANKIQSGIDQNNEAIINSAIDEIKNKWLEIKDKLEEDLAKNQTPAEVCLLIISQISQVKPQIEQGLSQLKLAQNEIELKKQECNFSSKLICEKVTDVYKQISLAKEKTELLLNQTEEVQERCVKVNKNTAWDEKFLKLMTDLKNNGLQWQNEIILLKTKWLKDKNDLEKELSKKPDVKTICGLKELAEGKIDIQRKFDDINDRLEKCNQDCVGTTEACISRASTCALYQSRKTEFDATIKKGEETLAKFSVFEQKCANPLDISLKEIIDLAFEIKQLGEDFINLRKQAID
jgi:hypothetical protein